MRKNRLLSFKIKFSKLIWKIAGISSKWGNRVMDTLRYKNYCKIAMYQKCN